MASDDLSPLDQSGALQKAQAGDVDSKAFEIPKDTDYSTWSYYAILRVFTGQADLVRAGTTNTPRDRSVPDPQTLYRAAAVLADTGSAIGQTRSELSALATSLNNGDWWAGPAASAIGDVLVQADNVLYDHESILYEHGDNLNSAAASLDDTINYIYTVRDDGRVALENWWNGLTGDQRYTWVELMGNQPPFGPGGIRFGDYPELVNGMEARMREALSNLAVAYRTSIANMPSPGQASLRGTGNFNPLNPQSEPPKIPKIEIPKFEIPKFEMPKVDIPKVDIPKVGDGPQARLDVPGLGGSSDPGAPTMPGLGGSSDPGAPTMPGLGGSSDPGAPTMPGLGGSSDPGAPTMPGLGGSSDPGAPTMPGLGGSSDPGAPTMPGLGGSSDPGAPTMPGLGGSSDPGAPTMPGLDAGGFGGPGGAFDPNGAPGSPGGAPAVPVPLPTPMLGGTSRGASSSGARSSSVTPPTAPNFRELAAGTNLPNGRIGAPNTGISKPPSSLPGLDGRLPSTPGPGPLGSSPAGPVGKLTPQQAAFSDLLKSNPQVAGLSTGSVKGPTAPEFGGPGGLGSRGGPGTTAGGPGMPGGTGAGGAAEAAKAASAARTAAAESGMLRGATAANGTNPGGMPYMPMGGMGGMPMGAGQRGGERERTTWLTEDEDTWGADCDTSDGVIGRPGPDRSPKR